MISPLTSDRMISQWQQELLVNTLLIRDPRLALHALRAPGPSINTPLRIKTLLANNLITEAFELQRSKFDEHLLLEFYKGCHVNKKWNYVLGLSLTEKEGEILCKFLKNCDSLLSENLQLLYLLQRNRYIEALTYLNDLKNKPRSMIMHKKLENTQDMIISSYKLAMNTTNRALCDQYMAIKDRLQVDVQENNETTSPLSSHLNPYIVDSNVVGSVFHRAIVSAKRTGFNSTSQKHHIPLLGNIRVDLDLEEVDEYKPILEPKPYIGLLKRRKEISYENNADPDQRQPAAKRQRTDSFSIADQPPKKQAPGINMLMTSLTNQSQLAKKAVRQMDLDDTIEIDNDGRNSLGELCQTINLLSTPVVRSGRLDKHNRIESRCQTPQSILKQRHTEAGSIISRRSPSPSLTVHSARRSVDFSAKPFCYKIPSIVDDEYRLGAIEETGHIQEDDSSSSIHSPSSIKGRRAIHSGKNSTASNSIDEFYSPETSKVQEEQQHEKSIQCTENNELSRISHQDESPVASNSNIKPRRRLRSKTPELPMMSSTRITRSRSKLNLYDSIDYENVTPQPVLNTSTPKRATPKRSSSRSLSKNVITSNALKVQSETQILSRDNEPQSIDTYSSNDSPDIREQRNYLKDASELSVKQGSMAYLTDDLDGTKFKQNLLQDSSSFASEEHSEDDVVEKLSERTASIQEEIAETVDQNVQETEDVEDEPISDQSTVDISMERVENEQNILSNQENIEITSVASSSTQDNPIPAVVVTETVSEQTAITVTPQNFLVDSSIGASESIVQEFNQYERYTSSFFSETTHRKNLLEDSSICTQVATESASNMGSGKDIVNLDDLEEEEQEEDDDDDDDDDGETSSNNTISSENSTDNELHGGLIYEESDNEENDEVIQISSSSDNDNQSQKSSDDVQLTGSHVYNEYDDSKYDINDEFATTSQPQATAFEDVEDFRITELQPAQVDVPPNDSEAQILINQEQAMNEMIYGDLGGVDAEMLDLDVHNDAFGFEMHGVRGEQNQGSVYLEAVEMASKQDEQTKQLISDDPSSGNIPSSSNYPSSGEQAHQPNSNEAQSVDQKPKHAASVVDDENAEIEENKIELQSNDVATESHEQSNVFGIPIQVEPIVDESNVQVDDATINETTAIDKTAAAAEAQPEGGNVEPMEVTETEDEPTNVFENAAIASTLNVIQSTESLTQESEQKMEPEKNESQSEPEQLKPIEIEEFCFSPQKTAIEDVPVRSKTPTRRTQRAASQQDTQKKKNTIEKVDDENEAADLPEVKPKAKSKLKKAASQQTLISIEETESQTKSRTKRAKSQQPAEPSVTDNNRKKRRGASEQREFTIKIERMESAVESIAKNAATGEPNTEDNERKKRGASKQKDLSAKVPSEEASSTSKTAKKRTRTKSITETGVGDKFDTEESVSTRRLRKATSHQSLSDAVDRSTIEDLAIIKRSKSPSRKKSEATAPRRAASHQSLSSISDSYQGDEEPVSRSIRAKSVSMQDISNPRTRRAASQQRLDCISEKEETNVPKRKKVKSVSTDSDSELGDRFFANESAPSHANESARLRNAVSHQTKIVESAYEESPARKRKSKIEEEPSTSRTTRRAISIQSLSSAADDEAKVSDVEVTKTLSRKRLVSDTSDKTEEKPEIESKTSKYRSRRTPSVTEKSPKESDSTTESRRMSKRSNKKDDDTHSEASSIVSTRSRKVNTDDETSSVKSSKVRATRSGSVLPPIAEYEATSTLSQDYLETSRLTRSQRAAVEKYAKLKEKISSVEPTASTGTTRRNTRKTKADNTTDELGSDHSDTESIVSQKSSVSKASKKSETSESAKSQRSTRQRTQKK